MRLFALCLASMIGAVPLAHAASSAQLVDKYHITSAEKAACSSDAVRLCFESYPDEDKLLACMRQNHEALSATCRVAFDAGTKRRRL